MIAIARKRPKQRAAIGMLGKDLTRRSKGRCELCQSRDGVRPYELEPFPDEPSMDRALCACERCRDWLDGGEIVSIEARFLEEAVWSTVRPIRLAAARLLVLADFADDPWVRDGLEAVGYIVETRELVEGTLP